MYLLTYLLTYIKCSTFLPLLYRYGSVIAVFAMYVDISMTYLPGGWEDDDNDDIMTDSRRTDTDTDDMLWFRHSVSLKSL